MLQRNSVTFDMPTIIVSSLDASTDAFERHAPGFVISILDCDDPTPEPFRALPKEQHLKLNAARDESAWCPEIIAFAKRWADTNENILIHCHRGVARSTAIAYILMCARETETCEAKIAKRLRTAAPHADPNLLLVSEADVLLGRDDRMVGAILDMCPCSATVAAPVVTLPVGP
ncbi:MAG: hypothetical protein AAFW68_02055 [Pseudomonadota bacterium]